MTDKEQTNVETQEGAEKMEKSLSQAEIYDQKVKEFKEELSKIDDVEELKKKEEEAIKEINTHDEYLGLVTYSLNKDVNFRGQVLKAEKVCEYIVDFLGMQEVSWQMTLGLYDLMEFWKDASKRGVSGVSYSYFDTTLRLLGNLKFKGWEMIRKIMIINTWLSSCHDKYTLDLAKTYYLADMHNAVLERIDAIDALTTPIK